MPAYEAGNTKFEYTGTFPDQLKLIKTLDAFPLLEVTAIASLNPRSREWGYSVGCRDKILSGKITYNAAKGAVEYRKALPFPVLGGMAKPVIAAEWQLGNISSNWRRPRLQLGLSVDDAPSSTDDGATMTNTGTLAFRRKLFLTRAWGVEVDGTAKFSFQHDLAGGAQGPGALANSLGLQVNAKELNIVCRI